MNYGRWPLTTLRSPLKRLALHSATVLRPQWFPSRFGVSGHHKETQKKPAGKWFESAAIAYISDTLRGQTQHLTFRKHSVGGCLHEAFPVLVLPSSHRDDWLSFMASLVGWGYVRLQADCLQLFSKVLHFGTSYGLKYIFLFCKQTHISPLPVRHFK